MIHDCQGLHGFPENHMVMATLRVRMFELGIFVSKNPCFNDFYIFNRRWSNGFMSFSKTLFGGNRFCVDVLTSWQKFTAVHKASTHGKVLKLRFGTTIKLRLAIRVFITSIGIQLLDDNGCYHININISTITLGNLNYNLIKR